jgi:hypothetical protein
MDFGSCREHLGLALDSFTEGDMRRTKLVLGMVAALWSGTALAQGVKLGVDGIVTVPVGNFSNVYGIGLGGLLRLEVSPAPGFFITGRSGYIQHLSKSFTAPGVTYDSKLGELPILAGAKFYTDSGLYGSLEAGGTYLNPSVSVTTGTTLFSPGSEFKLSAAAGLGFAAGPVELGARLHSVDLGHISDTLQIGFTLGFNFVGV